MEVEYTMHLHDYVNATHMDVDGEVCECYTKVANKRARKNKTVRFSPVIYYN
jgi:hypothetical protein